MSPHPEPVQGDPWKTLVLKHEARILQLVAENSKLTTALEAMTQERDAKARDLDYAREHRRRAADRLNVALPQAEWKVWDAIYTALDEREAYRAQLTSTGYVPYLDRMAELVKRAEAAERDLAALREENRQLQRGNATAVTALEQACGDLESERESRAQALRDAFEAGAIKQKLVSTDQRFVWHETKVGDGRWITIDDAFAAYLASRDGGTAG